MGNRSSKLKVGDWVEVRSKQEILQTLDAKGHLDGMPFMPEMFQWCGKKLQVYKRAHKTCDTVFPVRGRRVAEAVHLGTRCDGSAHGGCEAACLLFWKDAWLKPVDESAEVGASTRSADALPASGCSEADLLAHTQQSSVGGETTRYVCQATQLPYMTSDLSPFDIRQYLEDYWSGNAGLRRILSGWVYSMYFHVSQAGIGLGGPMEWFYNRFHRFWGGTPFPRNPGTIPDGRPTPADKLNLQPGELVRVKSYEEILQTLTTGSRNRGLWWDAEMVPYCGGTYRVLRRVTKILDEKTGVMQEMKTPCIILDSVVCQSRFSACRMFCPRAIYPYWREIWLERVSGGEVEATGRIEGSVGGNAENAVVSMRKSLIQVQEG
jgi:hypothetical protein